MSPLIVIDKTYQSIDKTDETIDKTDETIDKTYQLSHCDWKNQSI